MQLKAPTNSISAASHRDCAGSFDSTEGSKKSGEECEGIYHTLPLLSVPHAGNCKVFLVASAKVSAPETITTTTELEDGFRAMPSIISLEEESFVGIIRDDVTFAEHQIR